MNQITSDICGSNLSHLLVHENLCFHPSKKNIILHVLKVAASAIAASDINEKASILHNYYLPQFEGAINIFVNEFPYYM